MKTKIIVLSVTLLAALYPTILLSAPVPMLIRTPKAPVSTPGESLVLDPASGDYTITYADNAGNLQQSKFVPATKIEPAIGSTFKLDDNGIIAYRYTIANGRGAKQPITMISIKNISSFYNSQPVPPYLSGTTLEAGLAVMKIWSAPIVTPERWQGDASPDLAHASMVHANWSFSTEEYPNEKSHIGVSPGERQIGFGFGSRDLPAIGQVTLWGDTPIDESYVDEGPNPWSVVGKQLNVLETNNFVLRNAAAPTIAVPSPFDATILLDRIQSQMHTWIGMQLLDATFSAQLDRYFQSAISAYGLNQPKIGKKQIQTMRELIKKEQPDADRKDDNGDRGEKGDDDDKNKTKRVLIDKLAARILDFDLSYVTKRMGGDKDD
jgi:hypothetical protein